MADVKVPALLHKMSKAAQKAWYKKNNMKMPDDMEGRSAAAAKKVKVTPRKEIAVEPGSVRALNAARQQAYMAKGGRQPIGAAGSGGHSSMAGSNMSTAKGMIAGIKAGFNPKVSLDPYESEKAKKVGPRSLKMKKEEVELDEANMRFDYEAAARPKSSDVKNFLNRDKNPRAAAASKKYIRRMTKLGGLGPNQTKKDTEAHMKAHFEEVEQVDEAAKTKKEKLKALLYRDRSNVRELGKGAGLTAAQKAAARKAIANEEVELDEGSKRMSAAVKLQRAFDREKTASDASRKRGEEVLAQARAEYAKKQVAKANEEAEQIEEVTKKEAESMLGGPVKEKPKMPPGKQPAGYRYVRNLARKAMNKGAVAAVHRSMEKTMAKEEVELDEVTGYEGVKDRKDVIKRATAMNRMGKETFLAKVKARAAEMKKEKKAMKEEVKDQADVGEYDYEGDMAKSQLRSIMANSKRMHDMLEENTNLPEWVQSKITLAEDYISTASNYMQGEMNEEVEQIDEKINLAKAKMGTVIKDFKKSDAPQFKGKSMEKRRQMAIAAKLGAEREAGMREEVEQVTEAEGKVAVTPKEKALAAHHGDKTRITFGDVLKARLKSVAAKKMGK
jgi:hypothetical protein